MKKKTLFQMFINSLKRIFLPTHGKLLIHDVKLPKEVYDYHDEILSDLEMTKPSEDKINLRNDGLNLKKDIKKAHIQYLNECVNG